jgi:hypothetical protein
MVEISERPVPGLIINPGAKMIVLWARHRWSLPGGRPEGEWGIVWAGTDEKELQKAHEACHRQSPSCETQAVTNPLPA